MSQQEGSTKVYRASMPIEGSAAIYQCDVIEYQSMFWLVPIWLESLELGLRKPERIILLNSLPHQRVPGSPFGDFVVNVPVSKDVIEGRAPAQLNPMYRVIEAPDITIRIGPPASPGTVSTH